MHADFNHTGSNALHGLPIGGRLSTLNQRELRADVPAGDFGKPAEVFERRPKPVDRTEHGP